MSKFSILIEKQKNVFEKTFLALVMIAYVQPFKDGNKRTSRIVSNGILYANDCATLSYRDVTVKEYKKATIIFYEQNNVHYFKEIFKSQFAFSTTNYFQ